MRIAITGANGFIGSRLSNNLHQSGHDIIALVRHGSDVGLLDDSVRPYEIDYHDHNAVRVALSCADVIIHTAAMTKALSRREIYSANVSLTKLLCDIAKDIPQLRSFLFFSSQAAGGFADRNKAKPEDETSHPISEYGKSKYFAEITIRNTPNLPWTIIRPVSVFGEGDKDFLAYFRMYQKQMSFSPGQQDKLIDIIYVGDLCELTNMVILNTAALHRTFNAAYQDTISLRDFRHAVEAATGIKSIHLTIPNLLLDFVGKAGDIVASIVGKPMVINSQKIKEMAVPYWRSSPALAKRLLGFDPKPDLIDKLRKTYEWYKSHDWL